MSSDDQERDSRHGEFGIRVEGGRFLVAGAGLVGLEIADSLARSGAAYVRVSDVAEVGNLCPPGAEFCQGDFRDESFARSVTSGIDGIFHTAAVLTGVLAQSPRLAADVNCAALANILDGAIFSGAPKVVFSSSTAVHGDRFVMQPPWPSGAAVTAETPLPLAAMPATLLLYAASKLLGEALVGSYGARFGLPAISLRYSSPYGERLSSGMTASLLRGCLTDIRAGRPPQIRGDRKATRDLIHASDVAAANIAAMEADRRDGAYIVASGSLTTTDQMVRVLIRAAGGALEPEYTSAPEYAGVLQAVSWPYDISATIADLGWRPKIDLADGLARLVRKFDEDAEGDLVG